VQLIISNNSRHKLLNLYRVKHLSKQQEYKHKLQQMVNLLKDRLLLLMDNQQQHKNL
jgi:hypothetical protein